MTKTVTLGEIIKVKSGVNLTQQNMAHEGIYPVYGGNGITGKHSKFNVTEPTLIIGRVGYYCGSIHLTDGKAWVTDNAFITSFSPELADRKYLFHLLKNLDLRQYSNSSAQPVISGSKISSIECNLPTLPEQRRIAALLDRADALRQKDRQLLAHYDQLAQSIFLDLFGDPVRNEKGWEINKFGEVGKLDRGVSKHRPRNAPELLGGKHPLIQTGDVSNADSYLTTYKSTYSDIGLKQSRMWKAETLCITIAANIAKTAILKFDACFPDSVVGFLPDKSQTNSEYVRWWLSFLQKILEDSAPESAQKNINLEILRNLEIPVPPLPLQTHFAKLIEQIERQKAVVRRQMAASEGLFGRLLQESFG